MGDQGDLLMSPRGTNGPTLSPLRLEALLDLPAVNALGRGMSTARAQMSVKCRAHQRESAPNVCCRTSAAECLLMALSGPNRAPMPCLLITHSGHSTFTYPPPVK